jgi:hypothetical protein
MITVNNNHHPLLGGGGGGAPSYLERTYIEIRDSLQEEEWETLVQTFKLSLSPIPGRVETVHSHIGFSLTAAQSALFTEKDIKKLLELSFPEGGPIADPTGWMMTDLHGRKSIFIKSVLFRERLQKITPSPPVVTTKTKTTTTVDENQEELDTNIVSEFIANCVKPVTTNNKIISKAEVYRNFTAWVSNKKYHQVPAMKEFHKLFTELVPSVILSIPKSGYRYMQWKSSSKHLRCRTLTPRGIDSNNSPSYKT